MKTITILFALLFVVFAVVAEAQTVIYAPAPSTTPAPGYTYYNTITPSGQSQTGFVYTQPTTPTTGFQQDMTTGQQSTYSTQGNSTVILPMTTRK
jgi:hypothetical protein